MPTAELQLERADQKKLAIKLLKNPKLLTYTLEELDKDHIGDDRAKLFVFLCELSGILPKQYRFSCALLGDSSEGKTNIWKTTSQYLPSNWYISIDRITGACIEDDLETYPIIFFKELNEKGFNSQIIDYIKAVVEDGLDVMKKDVKDNFKSTVKRSIDRKVGIYSTTGSMKDDELAGRYCLVPVVGNQAKYKRVNIEKKAIAEDWLSQLKKSERKEKCTWITRALEMLEPVDFVEIPFASLIEEKNSSARSMRDISRFLNLISIIAWYHQKQRNIKTEEGHKILVASPEDVYNAYEIGGQIFGQSYTQLDERSQETLKNILKLLQEEGVRIEYEGLTTWVKRSALQAKMGLNSVITVKKRLAPLKSLGIIRLKYERGGSRCYIAFNGDVGTGIISEKEDELSFSPSNTRYRPYFDPSVNSFLKLSPTKLYSKIITGQNMVNNGLIQGSMTGQNKEIKSDLIKFSSRKHLNIHQESNRPINKINISRESSKKEVKKKGDLRAVLENTDRSNKNGGKNDA